MIDLAHEALIPLAAVPGVIGKLPGMDAQRVVTQKTVYNWTARGRRGVVLESVPVGTTTLTSREALVRFLQSLATERQQRFAKQRCPAPHRAPRRRLAPSQISRHGI